jgi:hypothetical protein
MQNYKVFAEPVSCLSNIITILGIQKNTKYSTQNPNQHVAPIIKKKWCLLVTYLLGFHRLFFPLKIFLLDRYNCAIQNFSREIY